MSSISSIGGGDLGLSQFYQQISGATASPAAAAPAAVDSATVTDPAADTTQAAQASGHHHHGHGGGLFKKIESAVTTALQSAQSDPSADPNKVVEDAIAKVFKDNGVTPPNGTDASAGVKPNDPDGDGDQDASGQGGGVSSAKSAFAQTLQGFGIDPAQFHSDFLAAVKDAQNGSSDPSSLFQDFPVGSTVDTTA